MLEKITAIIREFKSDDSVTLAKGTTFEELELDSLDTVELIMTLEDEFGVAIEIDESLRCVGDLMKVIENG